MVAVPMLTLSQELPAKKLLQRNISISTNIIIIIPRPKPAYGRQGLAGSWGQDTDKVSNFWVFLTSHFAQLGIKPTWDHS